MDITITDAQGNVAVKVLQPHGNLDGSTYLDLIAEAEEQYNADARNMIIDLSDTSFVSSSGLVAIHRICLLLRGEEVPDPETPGWEAHRAIKRDVDGGVQEHLKLLSPQPAVEKVLDMAGFTQFLEIHTDLDAAVASF
jgi:anti-anti-sigma regulatory factor